MRGGEFQLRENSFFTLFGFSRRCRPRTRTVCDDAVVVNDPHHADEMMRRRLALDPAHHDDIQAAISQVYPGFPQPVLLRRGS